jgi:hypothetical protein
MAWLTPPIQLPSTPMLAITASAGVLTMSPETMAIETTALLKFLAYEIGSLAYSQYNNDKEVRQTKFES